MKKLILNWLFGADDIKGYMDLLYESRNYYTDYKNALDDHLETLRKHGEDLDIMRKLIKVCKNHGINVDEEIENIEL